MTAKHVMIKEKIDRQKTGQSPATPFMWMNECGQTNKKGVAFDAMETLERHSNSTDRLTSLVSMMNVKLDKKEAPYKPRVYQSRPRGNSRGRQQNFQPQNPLAGIETDLEGIIIIEIIDPTLETDPGTVIDMTTEEIITCPMRDAVTTDRIIEGEITIDKSIEIDKIIEEMTLDKEKGVRVEIDWEIIVMTAPGVEKEVEIEMDRCNLDPELCQMTDDRWSRSRSNSRVNTNRDRLRCYRCGEHDHFAQEFPNIPTDNEMGHSDSEQASLQMLTQDSLPLNSNGEVEYLNI